MDQKMIIVSSVIGSLGVLSAILGFSAEGTKLTVWTVYRYRGVCLYPQNPAPGLGVCAAIFGIVAQIVFAVVGGCCGCCKSRAIPSETNRIVGVICAVFSWIAAVVAFGLLVNGAAWNATGTRDSSLYGSCYVLKDGIFAGGAVLTLIATALGLTSYIMLTTQPATTAAAAAPMEGEQMPAGTPGMATGLPQLPQVSPKAQGHPKFPPAASPSPAQGYAVHTPNQQQPELPPLPLPAQGYSPHARDPQMPAASPAPAQGHGPHTPNQQALPELPPKGHEMLARPV
uniref:Uncharacterized protein n=2 Tax=Hordeum vulgare subsp. vulgare TaxID=112509 RepID=A0A8I6W7E6_HORVV